MGKKRMKKLVSIIFTEIKLFKEIASIDWRTIEAAR